MGKDLLKILQLPTIKILLWKMVYALLENFRLFVHIPPLL